MSNMAFAQVAPPSPTLPARGRVRIELACPVSPSPPAGTSPLTGEAGRGCFQNAAASMEPHQ